MRRICIIFNVCIKNGNFWNIKKYNKNNYNISIYDFYAATFTKKMKNRIKNKINIFERKCIFKDIQKNSHQNSLLFLSIHIKISMYIFMYIFFCLACYKNK